MKLSKDKEINNTNLITILVISSIVFAMMGFDFIQIVLMLIFIVFPLIYLFHPRNNTELKTSRNELITDKKNTKDEQQGSEKTLSEKQKNELVKRWEQFGNYDAVCPSCNHQLDKFPQRKIKCKNCGKTINRGKNHFTGKYCLFSDKQDALYVELLWLSNGTWQAWFDNFEEINSLKKELASVYKYNGDYQNIPLNDVIWGKLQRKLGHLAEAGDWINYKSTLETSIRFLNDEGKVKPALALIFQYIYLSYNVSDFDDEFGDIGLDFPKTMGSPQICLIENMVKDTSNFEKQYYEFIDDSAFPKIFNLSAKQALTLYQNEKNDYLKALDASK
ncbi:TPA: hypothetical protein I8672_002559 [Legionella pneumophila]|nr:hypothetical protein [Legionella pneumophila]